MPYIYKITNKVNGRVYIGKTVNTVEQRWKEHIRESKLDRAKNRPLYRAINKYGVDNFYIEVVEECKENDPELLNEKECYWIEYYGSFKNGYNATIGGDGKVFLDYDLIYKTYLKTKNIKQTSVLCNCSIDSVSKILEIYGITKETRIKNGQNSNKVIFGHPVAMINKNTDEIIKVFNTVREAGRYINKGHQHISDVCKGKRKTAYGYKWKYL